MFDREDKDYFDQSKFVIELKPKDFDPVATWELKKHKCSIVLFYAPWCPHCKAMQNIWEQLGETAAFFDVCSYNCEKNRSHLSKIQEDMPELVRGFPTIIVYEKGKPVERVGENESERNVPYFIKVCMRSCKKSQEDI